MSTKKIYEVFSDKDYAIQPLITVDILTNLSLTLGDNEFCFFKICNKLFISHGIASFENFIHEDGTFDLKIKVCKICKINDNVQRNEMIKDPQIFQLRKGDFIGNLVIINLNENDINK